MAINRMEIGVAGVTFEGRQAALAALHCAQESGQQLAGSIRREPGNAYDPNAVQVLVEGTPVGYVPRTLAATIAPRLDSGEAAQVTGVRIIRGDHDRRTVFGARIDVAFALTDKEAVSCPQQQRLL